MPRLKITSGSQSGKTLDVSKATIIGRGDTAQLQISDKAASREHCKVFEQGGAWVVADLNSRNGIKINGVSSTRKNLAHGDKIVIGETTIEFEAGGGGGAPAKPAADAKKDKEAAFAAARAGTAPPKKGASAPAGKAAPAGEGSGLKVSDHVLQFHKVDAKNASVLDVDLSQSPGMSRMLVVLACLAFLGLVVWGVVKMMG
jgi:predicted component of type VI protein secretion system